MTAIEEQVMFLSGVSLEGSTAMSLLWIFQGRVGVNVYFCELFFYLFCGYEDYNAELGPNVFDLFVKVAYFLAIFVHYFLKLFIR